eukprot:849317-Amphidinium_carterae.1
MIPEGQEPGPSPVTIGSGNTINVLPNHVTFATAENTATPNTVPPQSHRPQSAPRPSRATSSTGHTGPMPTGSAGQPSASATAPMDMDS